MNILDSIKDNKKTGPIWNALAGLVDAAEAVVLMIVVTRTAGLEAAGILTIAFSIGNLMMTIGKYGMRNYQVTDVIDRFSFRNYLHSRFFTVGLMFLASSVYLAYCIFFQGYTLYKIGICLGICAIYMVESMEDVFWGLYQRHNRIDIGAKIFIARWISHLIVICVMLALGIDLLVALLVGLLIGTIVTLICNIVAFNGFKSFVSEKKSDDRHQMWQLLGTVFPLFIVLFLTIYLSNASKYAIDRFMSEEAQACYGFIAMPVFVVSLLNQFIYQPILVKLAEQWRDKNYKAFRKGIFKDALIIVALTVVCIVGAWFLGIPVLSWLYNTDLSAYRVELVILLFGSGFMATSTFICVVMTVMRVQKYSVIGYGIAAVAAFFSINPVVERFGIMGAAVDYVGIMLVLTVVLVIVAVIQYRKIVVNYANKKGIDF